jgi:predicted CXXCH cytochrome family protein
MFKRVLLLALVMFTIGFGEMPVAFALFGFGARPPVLQPVAFNHKLHVEENGLGCVDCHVYVTAQTFAGLPDLERCLECHEEDQSGSAEEEKIRQAAAKGEELPWNRIYTVPNHVYYSHRRHVVAGKLDCRQCHGAIAETTSPSPRPLNELSMRFCMDCHEKNDVTNDCIACHM